MKTHVCTLTESGQISIPANFHAERGLKPGDKLPWNASGDKALLVTTVETTKRKSFKSAIGNAKTFRKTMSTGEWMKILREGEEDDE